MFDAGCWSGFYNSALIDQVHTIEVEDLNEGILRTAASKMKSEVDADRIHFQHGPIEALFLGDNSVNALMVNQVFRHLPFDIEAGWEGLKGILQEFFRVLKTGAILVINSCSPEQLDQGFWFYKLIPDSLEIVKNKVI